MNNIVNSDAFNARCQMIIVPISTEGTISDSFQYSLHNNKIRKNPKKKLYKLGEIEVHKIQHLYVKYIVFACSVYQLKSNYSAIGTLAEKIGSAISRRPSVKQIGMPLLGTGAGGLEYFKSLDTIFMSFYKAARLDAELIFCIPDYEIFMTLKGVVFTPEGVNILRIRELIIRNIRFKSTHLDLGNCGIRNLEVLPELFRCVHLESLILSNEWGEYSGGRWTKRKSTNIGVGNILEYLPAELAKLKKLNIFICGGNWNTKSKSNAMEKRWTIKDISIISSFRYLKLLNVSNNDIEFVGEINKLENLEIIYLNNNRISSFPNISKLRYLRGLYLSNNNLINLNFIKNARSINTLDLHSNNISNLLPLRSLISKIGIEDSKWEMYTISIAENPLEIPAPEVIIQGKEKVLAYFKLLAAEQSINLPPFINRDIKLILVGNSNVGKSTLVYWLKNNSVKKGIPTTHWMITDKCRYNVNGSKYTIRIFDFGGQEYYHDTHHLFFTNNTAYLVLWEEGTDRFDEVEIEQQITDDIRENVRIQTFPLTYWLDSIEFHTRRKVKAETERAVKALLVENENLIRDIEGDKGPADQLATQPGASNSALNTMENIIVVQNKVDSMREKVFIDQKNYKDTYGRIYDFMAVSVWNRLGTEVLKDSLFKVFDSIVGKEYLGTWGSIKTRIESETFYKPFYLEEFKSYCNDVIKGIPEVNGKSENQVNSVLFSNQNAESYAQYLNEIGMALYFPENEDLKDKIFLNQDQVLKNIYTILEKLDLSQGKFHLEDAINKLKKIVIDEEVTDTIKLMLHFKIIFQHPTRDSNFIAPLYLPKEPNESIKIFTPVFHKPIYRYAYKKFIYKNVILDFFHAFGKKAMKESDSVDHYYYWKQGIVLRDDASGEIIMVKFVPANKNDQATYIDVYRINFIQSEIFLNQVVQYLDKINQDWDITKTVTANGEDFIPLSVIHKNEEDENWIFHYGKKYHKLSDFKKHLLKPIKMKNIFISYSKQDFELVTKFIEHLSALQIDGTVAHWYCSELIAGTEWDSAIQKHFDNANIICFMISPNFMKTKYIHEYEITKAFEKKALNPDFKIIPIILDFCRWNTTKNDLSKFTALPYTAKPVVDFENQNMAWYIIQECLRLMIIEDLDPIEDDFYSAQNLPSDVKKLYARIVSGKVDKNSL